MGQPGHRDTQSDRAGYEGPPGHVHGGVSAMVLDHVLGEAASDGKNPRLTGTISLRYGRATRLGAATRRSQDRAD